MKGVGEAISAIIMTGVMIGVVSSVYFWGLPLVQKSKDVSTLQNSERFMGELSSVIIELINSPGRRSLVIDVPGILEFDGNKFTLSVDTDGTIYSEGEIALGRNACSPDAGTWGVDDYATLCATSEKIGDKYKTVYTLKYIQLDTEGIDSHRVEFSGAASEGGEGHTATVESKGASEEMVSGRRITKVDMTADIA